MVVIHSRKKNTRQGTENRGANVDGVAKGGLRGTGFEQRPEGRMHASPVMSRESAPGGWGGTC